MKIRVRYVPSLLLVLGLLFPVLAQAQFFLHLSGAPASIDCQSTQVTLSGGNLTLSWNLPPSDLSGSETILVNGVVVFTTSGSLSSANGSQLITGASPSYGPVAFPYTIEAVLAAHAPGVAQASYSVSCPAAGPGTNFKIQNASQFTAVPTISTSGLLLLGLLLTIATMAALRRR